MTLIRSNLNQISSQVDGRHSDSGPAPYQAQTRVIATAEQAPVQPAPREGWELVRGRLSNWYYRRSR